MKTRFERSEHAGLAVLSVVGPLEERVADELEKRLLDGAADTTRGLLVDLSATDAVEAKVLPVFSRVAERLEAKGSRLALWVAQPKVRSTFDVLGGQKGLKAHASREQALRWLEQEERFERIAQLTGALLRETGPWNLRQRALRGKADILRLEMAQQILGGAATGRPM